MIFSVIIINYKTAEITANCLRSLLRLPDNDTREIIVVDNQSGDGSVDYLLSCFGETIKIITNKNNAGFARANNLAAQSARGKYLLFLNSDTIVSENIFTELESIFNSHDSVAAISPLLLQSDGSEQDASYGRFPTLCRLASRRVVRKSETDINGLIKTDWISGCAMAVRKSAFQEIGEFDENFFLYYEDVDLCKRLKRARYECVVDRKTAITHLGGQSLINDAKRKKYYYSSQDYYFKKHFGLLAMIVMRLIRWPIKLFRTSFR